MSKALIPLGLIGVAGVMGSLPHRQVNRGRRAADLHNLTKRELRARLNKLAEKRHDLGKRLPIEKMSGHVMPLWINDDDGFRFKSTDLSKRDYTRMSANYYKLWQEEGAVEFILRDGEMEEDPEEYHQAMMRSARGRRAQKSDARLKKELRLAQWAAGFPYPYDMALERRYLPGGMGVTLDSRKWAENADLDEMYYGSSQLRGDEIVVARIYNHDDLGGSVVYSDLIIDLGAGTVRRTGGRGKAINYRDRNRVGWESVDEYDFARQVDAEGDASLDSISREVSRGLFNRAPVSGRSARGRRAATRRRTLKK